jgi:LuxR family glucitol operon transcriptional activator
MSYNTSRLTLYALISAFEIDLRNFITAEYLIEFSLKDLLSEEAYQKLTRRAKNEQEVYDDSPSDNDLLEYIDFQESIEIINSHKDKLSIKIQSNIKNIFKIFTSLTPIRNRVMHSRPLLINDFSQVVEACEEAKTKWPNLFSELLACMLKLEESPEFVFGLTLPSANHSDNISHNLPIPDFDETGFIGREDDAKQVKSLIKGAYPVINLVGIGGLGKTALALKVAYDILDDPDCNFDSIVWVTAKTTTLGTNEILRIENAISDSIGIFNKICDELSGTNENPFDEIYSYMREFKILLILDNLETVLDGRIKNFLRDIPNGSKILLTSRVGLGGYDCPYNLSPMDEKNAIKLLRLLAKALSISNLAILDQQILKKYVSKMKSNPGFIKWFVIAVSKGERPDKLLVAPKLFLEFCMQNVYEHLSKDSKNILNVMLTLNVEYSISELHYFTDIDTSDLEKALLELMSSNMINMQNKTNSIIYKLSEIPNLYLKNFYKPATQFTKKINEKRMKIYSSTELLEQASKKHPYNLNNIAIPDKSFRVVAKYLSDALKTIKKENFNEAWVLIEKAKSIEPNYYEVYRVEAYYYVQNNDIFPARASYEIALDIDSSSAPLRYFFGGFLMRKYNDNEEALKHFKKGYELDNNSLFKIEIIRAYLYLHEFDKALHEIELLIPLKDQLDERGKMILASLNLQYFKRKGEYLINQREYSAGINSLGDMIEYFKELPIIYQDETNKKNVRSAFSSYKRAINAVYGSQEMPDKVETTLQAFEVMEQEKSNKQISDSQGRLNGIIVKMKHEEKYGFIKSESGDKYFFHRDYLEQPTNFEELVENKTLVKFESMENKKGLNAINVSMCKTA